MKNKRNAYYAMPTLTDSSYRGETYIAPMTYATACISRNKGNYIRGILVNCIAPQIKTMNKLVEFMERECYSFNAVSFGKYKAWEGLFLEQDGNDYVYGYSEREHKDIEKRFDNEEEAVRYVFDQSPPTDDCAGLCPMTRPSLWYNIENIGEVMFKSPFVNIFIGERNACFTARFFKIQ